jgi:hypothetical protein
VNGITFKNSAAIRRCGHAERGTRNRSPRAYTTTTSVAAPSATRPSATQVGDQWRSSTLMNRKLDPQIAASAMNCVRHPSAICIDG